MLSFADHLYAISPVWLQNLGISVYGVVWKHRRFGGKFKEALEGFTARESYSPEQWEAYQIAKLRQLIAHSIRQVPYYLETYRGIISDYCELDGFGFGDLAKLPPIEKETIRQYPDQFIASDVDRKDLHTYHTSGTTGTPLAIEFTNETHRVLSAAYEARVRRWAGVSHKMSRAMIGGRMVVPKADAKPPFWRYNLAERQLYMSAFHISPENARYYVDALNDFEPDYLVGYASAHFFLARMICEQGLEVHRPKAVLTSSEKLTPEMRAIIEQAYSCKVFDAYSGLENCCLASECEYHRMHVSPDVGIIELLDKDDQPVSPGQPGQIVATGLVNFAQPLIRYRTGDWAILSNDPCPCGRKMPILKELVGRLEDIVIGPDGREMVRFHGIFVGLPHIREGQVIQETLSKFRLKLVVVPQFNEKDREIIYKRFEERLGPVDLTIELVDRIECTERGKFRAVVSKVQRGSLLSSSG